MPTRTATWGSTQHRTHRQGENVGSYEHHWATGWSSPESLYVLTLRSLSQFPLTASAITGAPTSVFWHFVPKPHHPTPPLVRLLSLVRCHFSVTDEKTWIKAPSMVLNTLWAQGKLSARCFVLLLSFEHSLSQVPTIVFEMFCVIKARSQQASGRLTALKPRSPGGCNWKLHAPETPANEWPSLLEGLHD